MSRTLRKALASLRPDATESVLLQACLGGAELCREAWTAFQRDGRELPELFRADYGQFKRHGPLLLHNLSRHDLPLESRLATVLRTARFREELRARICREVFCQALEALAGAGLEPLVLRGPSLSETLYADPALRHTHDLELLLAPAERSRAVAALQAADCTVAPAEPSARESWVTLIHRSSLPIRLHATLYDAGGIHPAVDGRRRSSRCALLAGMSVRVLGPEDQLANVLAHAAHSPSRATLQWVCDAWLLAQHYPQLASDPVAAGLGEARLLLSGLVMLEYLASLGAPLEPRLLTALEQRAGALKPIDRDFALHGLRRGSSDGLAATLRRMPDLSTRLAILGWTLFPTAEYVRWAQQARHAALLPAYYLIRILRAAGLGGRTNRARG